MMFLESVPVSQSLSRINNNGSDISWIEVRNTSGELFCDVSLASNEGIFDRYPGECTRRLMSTQKKSVLEIFALCCQKIKCFE